MLDSPALVIKKLRYYARFVVVCLLMNRRDVVKSIVDELNVLVEEYGKAFRVTDLNEWQAVVQEVNAFTEAQKRMMPVDLEGTRLPVQHRLADVGSAVDLPADVPAVRLQEVLVVGNVQQVGLSNGDNMMALLAFKRYPTHGSVRSRSSSPS